MSGMSGRPTAWLRPRFLSELDTGGRDNNYNLLRLTAAFLVIVTHSYAITGRQNSEPLYPLAHDAFFSLGMLAVYVFFMISGYLVTKSFVSRHSLAAYAEARILRIYPALIVAVLFSMAVGAWFTTWPIGPFLAHPQTHRFALYNMTLLNYRIAFVLPGVFEHHPYPLVNGSLWTLPSEVRMYAAVGLLGALGLLRRRWTFALGLGAIVAAALAFGGNAIPFLGAFRLAPFFAVGACAYVFRAVIPVSTPLLVLLAAGVVASAGTPWLKPMVYVTLAYGTFWFAYVPGGFLRRFNRLGDYSYGTYIFAFPIQQTIRAVFPGVTPMQMVALAFAATLPLAALSWHFLEHPMLRLKGRTWLSRLEGKRRGWLARAWARIGR
jgi:peptidoglycan/LPS O-acetylase OafA/YrhL